MPYKDIEQKRAKDRENYYLRKTEGHVRPKRDRTEYRKKYYEKHKEKLKAASSEYYNQNKGDVNAGRRAQQRAYRSKNRELINQKARDYAADHKELLRARQRKYRLSNKGKVNARVRAYQLCKIQRTPVWLTEEHKWLFVEIYDLAALRTEKTHVLWHVDHIVPLNGKAVSGLHVPWNLRVIIGVHNLRKGCKLED